MIRSYFFNKWKNTLLHQNENSSIGSHKNEDKTEDNEKTVEEQLSKGCLTGKMGYVIYSPDTTPGEHVTYPRGIGK